MPFPSPGDLSDPGIKPTSPVDVADRFFNLSHLGSLLAAAGAKSLPSIMASLAAQLVKNLPGMRETWVRSKGWEDPLEKGIGYPLQYSGLENSMDSPWGHKELDMTERLSPSQVAQW